MKYYIAEGTAPTGPFEIEEIRQRAITPDTLVWCTGMTDWVPASTVDELQPLFEPVPPPLTPPEMPASPETTPQFQQYPQYTQPTVAPQPQYYDTATGEQKPFDWLWPSIAVTICCCTPLAIVGIVYAAQVNSHWNRGEYERARKDANLAKIWTLVALGLSLIGNIIYAALYPSLLASL